MAEAIADELSKAPICRRIVFETGGGRLTSSRKPRPWATRCPNTKTNLLDEVQHATVRFYSGAMAAFEGARRARWEIVAPPAE
jgi:hypothetical protein